MTTVGAPGVLVAEDVDTPRPATGEVLVRAEAIPVLYPETLMRSGTFPFPAPLPAVFGFQAAGTVVEVGAGADRGLVGERVVVSTPGHGSYAEYVVASSDSVTRIPHGLEPDAAAAILMAGSVAIALFDAATPSAGETVLVEAAATGVGASLTRLCVAAGLRVIATAGGPAKAELARANGAHEVIDHNAPGWAARLGALLDGDTLGVVFDSIGGDSLAPLLDLVTALHGRILSYGWLAGAPARVGAADLILRGLTLTGCAGPAWLGTVAARQGAALAAAAAGKLVPVVDTVLPLTDAAKAHRLLEERVALGSVLLRP
ncbi:quinone oxidoreductase family protein [Nocardia caishijiensis]|uniref:NADPH:quinone reductase-like Zn-dependent oxidoreductase n=1 Tax=Nocardia caishijiensis TaxID=184756 RepID=A0ABQ6YNS6_9NOCA|nr:zinc-binding dehydrogenase [Nocardia caishijiensis]KAF0847454.1 NADPH:quinone reductase-like Zn-dependent oxidoreductase [Nocardia caishijiensis]